MDEKNQKQPPVRPERSETPVSQVRYVLCYERHSSYLSTDGKKLKQPPVSPEISVTSVSRVRYILWYEWHSSYRRTTEKIKNSHPQVQPVGQKPRTLDTKTNQELEPARLPRRAYAHVCGHPSGWARGS